ncbi:hypothetical protein MUN76_15255 [Leucobacter rhizosphaerae]|uniref:Uncharacterized protein n=1 Tax=Leucobacter rhizosphaerae TaxID=2932245 RepID=A0ABY4FVN6_9MICO|nr:hypothetical protein [Leucobacter rhizosphaerae]UOQ60366.1 hypothetical protein MUN76_15255 [Leucobacter rhizosphaerae]
MSDLDLDRMTSDATFALARSIHGKSADHEDHDYYRKHAGVALDAVVPAMIARVRELEASIERVKALHRSVPARYFGTDLNPSRQFDCWCCGEGKKWPCPTIRALSPSLVVGHDEERGEG